MINFKRLRMNNQKDYTIAEFFTLPSEGKVYSELIDSRVQLRSMTTAEEMRRLSPTDHPYENLCSIIDDCIVQGPPNSKQDIPKPEKLEEMLELSKILSANMIYARIDFYIIQDTVKFGEITMYPTSGFSLFDDPQTDILLGSWIKLPIDS